MCTVSGLFKADLYVPYFFSYTVTVVCVLVQFQMFLASVTTSLQQRNICYDLGASKQLCDCVT